MTANYYGMISQIDHNVGRILSALEAAGVADNTLVIYTTDHGELLGNHGLYLKARRHTKTCCGDHGGAWAGRGGGSWWWSRFPCSIWRHIL
jgi:arylsulfatase A-like enzyme